MMMQKNSGRKLDNAFSFLSLFDLPRLKLNQEMAVASVQVTLVKADL